uniref:Endonuclease V n=1 Tax=Trieres chinensis TaxID=1514140 RepID=A0A7S2ECW9_TRICV|eukprot:CAMPEP_0183292168 /NCGR_PEP_ID=MMETSP0160_2-20130417/1330_1 /TAXON_ID=2839 ORGANISM="Odontella Sinensis, Strain Grunow 1884" /NCGR_SAMPLE_ID=MMETSP0160_2 /ASSEMBLY_ACC=CAM_ASM_000250 /LENGTH=335 /DNA_ID=CAMNT_0025453087 /DNA_START=41 /DNA_END=1048 /DNA_ORIENTATION=-
MATAAAANPQTTELEALLASWREEQHRVSSQVAILDDPPTTGANVMFGAQYKIVSNDGNDGRLYGGVDVSFPENEGDPSVAVYVVVSDGEIVYEASETFQLKVPYISSYLSFREIEPLERLVKKQMKERPEFTPRAILVDGNGIMHERKAGIACFLGVRTGLRTIGVGKTLYCQDGLSTKLVSSGVIERVQEFQQLCEKGILSSRELAKLKSERGLVFDQRSIDAKNSAEAKTDKKDMKGFIRDLFPFCSGFAMKLRGMDGTIWGAALVAHGGKITSSKREKSGTKNPIFVSIGHGISLEEAVQVCAELALARIPEPIRMADLKGRELMRKAAMS